MKLSNEVNLTEMGYGVQPIAQTQAKALLAKKKFVQWMNKNHPALLRDAIKHAHGTPADVGLSGLGASNSTATQTSWYDKILNALPAVVSGYTAVKQQKQLIELNKKRAEQGLQPLQNPPAIKVSGEAGPQTRAALQQSIKQAAAQYIPWVAGGLGLLLLMQGRKRGRG